MADIVSNKNANSDEIDFSPIIRILWKHRKLIIFGTLGATLLAVGISFILPKTYRSEGFFQFGNPRKMIVSDDKKTKKDIVRKNPTEDTSFIGIPLPIYKSSSTQFFNPNRFLSIASQDKTFKEGNLKQIEADFRTSEDISKWIKPVYAFTKDDAREFAQLPQDQANSVIGLKLSYEADSPENAYACVSFFGNYIRDCLLYVTLNNYVMNGYSNTIAETSKNENDIIDIQFKLLQNTNKRKDIQAILSNYPESAQIENRQLVSIEEGGDRFLAPVTQLVGIESALADLRRDLAELERDREKLAVREEYFTRCYSELEKVGERGEALFLLIKSAKDEVFKNKDLNNDALKEVFNNLSIDLQTFDFTFFSISRFISGPTLPAIHVKPRKSIIVTLSFLGSFFVLVISAFISHWWQSNRKSILSDPTL